jgi:putative transcriptional regulator
MSGRRAGPSVGGGSFRCAKQTNERHGGVAKTLSEAARKGLAATDWHKVDAMTDADIARQIAANPDAAPDMAPEIDVRAIRRATGMTQAQFAAAYEFSLRTVQEWERGAKRPSGPARTLLRAIKGDPEGLRKAIAAA